MMSVEVRMAVAPQIEIREADDGALMLAGYAAVYGSSYPVGGRSGWVESFESGAFAGVLEDDVRLLVDHTSTPLARTRSGTMTLTDDELGLRVAATLDPESPMAATVLSALRRGDLDQMSHAFIVDPAGDRWSDDYTTRTITRVAELRDVSIVTYPANPDTLVVAGRRPAARHRSLRLARAQTATIRAISPTQKETHS